MEQDHLFYDSAEEAVNAALIKSGKPAKQIAAKLWPHLKMDSAYARLKNSLNPAKDEKLTLDEIILVCRLTDRFDPLYYMADELSHTRPQIICARWSTGSSATRVDECRQSGSPP